jgi:hypothetical protein
VNEDSSISTGPAYELRVGGLGGKKLQIEIWQMPSPATPRLKKPERLAGLKGRVLEIVETRVLRRLKAMGIRSAHLKNNEKQRRPLDEDLALNLALLFRVLAPMRNIDKIRIVARGVDAMSREEAGYWLGMALHRKKPRRVLAALRLLLTTI